MMDLDRLKFHYKDLLCWDVDGCKWPSIFTPKYDPRIDIFGFEWLLEFGRLSRWRGHPLVTKKEHERMSWTREPIAVKCKACDTKMETKIKQTFSTT